MKKVLVVEDNENFHRLWGLEIEERMVKVQMLSALTIEEAEKILATSVEIDAIVMDACVPGTMPNTIPLVRKIRESFQGPILATSNEESYRQQLMAVGCDCETDKVSLVNKLLEVLFSPVMAGQR